MGSGTRPVQTKLLNYIKKIASAAQKFISKQSLSDSLLHYQINLTPLRQAIESFSPHFIGVLCPSTVPKYMDITSNLCYPTFLISVINRKQSYSFRRSIFGYYYYLLLLLLLFGYY